MRFAKSQVEKMAESQVNVALSVTLLGSSSVTLLAAAQKIMKQKKRKKRKSWMNNWLVER